MTGFLGKIWYRIDEQGASRLRTGRVLAMAALMMAVGMAAGYGMGDKSGELLMTRSAEAGSTTHQDREIDGFLVNVDGLNMLLVDVRASVISDSAPESDAEIRDRVLRVFDAASRMPVVENGKDRETAFREVVSIIAGHEAPWISSIDFTISETRMRG